MSGPDHALANRWAIFAQGLTSGKAGAGSERTQQGFGGQPGCRWPQTASRRVSTFQIECVAFARGLHQQLHARRQVVALRV